MQRSSVGTVVNFMGQKQVPIMTAPMGPILLPVSTTHAVQRYPSQPLTLPLSMSFPGGDCSTSLQGLLTAPQLTPDNPSASDKAHIRSDNLRAVKRRSWATLADHQHFHQQYTLQLQQLQQQQQQQQLQQPDVHQQQLQFSGYGDAEQQLALLEKNHRYSLNIPNTSSNFEADPGYEISTGRQLSNKQSIEHQNQNEAQQEKHEQPPNCSEQSDHIKWLLARESRLKTVAQESQLRDKTSSNEVILCASLPEDPKTGDNAVSKTSGKPDRTAVDDSGRRNCTNNTNNSNNNDSNIVTDNINTTNVPSSRHTGNHYTANPNKLVPVQSPTIVVAQTNTSIVAVASAQQISGQDKCEPRKSRLTKGLLKSQTRNRQQTSGRRVFFDPLALLLDAALEGELDLVKQCSSRLPSVSLCNDEGITALHNAICAGHYDIVRFLVEAAADVNAQDSDGWTPLHCAASCNNLPMVKFLVEHGACVFATTVSDHETPAEKCEQEEEGYDGCSQFLLTIQEKLGYLHDGRVYVAHPRPGEHSDELNLRIGDELVIVERTVTNERGWWMAQQTTSPSENTKGLVPRNFLALYPRVTLRSTQPGRLEDPSITMVTTEAKYDL